MGQNVTTIGTCCNYYVKSCLSMDIDVKLKNKFSPSLCKEITWRIIDEGRDFFSMCLDPEGFRRGVPVFKKYAIHYL